MDRYRQWNNKDIKIYHVATGREKLQSCSISYDAVVIQIIRTLKVTCTSRFRLSPEDLITESRAANSFYFRGIERWLLDGVITVYCTCARAEREYTADTLVSYNEQRAEQCVFLSRLSPVRLRRRTRTVKSEKERQRDGERKGEMRRDWLVLYKARSAITIATSVMRAPVHLHAI